MDEQPELTGSPKANVQRFVRGFVFCGAIAGIAVGLTVLIGWKFNMPAATTIFPGLASMKPNTALCFMLLGASLFCLERGGAGGGLQRAGKILAGFLLAAGAATLSQYIFRMDLHIDELLHQSGPPLNGAAYPLRMTPMSAVNFILLGGALFGIKARSAFAARYSRWLAAAVHFSGTLALLGYAYQVESLYNMVIFSTMALHTAFLFWLLSACIFATNTSRGIMRIVVGDSVAGAMARRFIPAIPVVLFTTGLLSLAGEHRGYYDQRITLALMTVAGIFVLSMFAIWLAGALEAQEGKRAEAAAALAALNATLEQRVEERTRELAQSLAEVNQLSGMLPICSYCKKVRDDKDYWHNVESFVSSRSEARFSHGICPNCLDRMLKEEELRPRRTPI